MARSTSPLSDGERALLARAVIGLTIIGASCAMALECMGGRWLGPFVSGNVLSAPQRHRLMLGLALGALSGVVVAAAAYFPARFGAGPGRLSRVARLAAPLGVAGPPPRPPAGRRPGGRPR